MKLHIVRHGDPDYALDSLTEQGAREAALLADRLEKLPASAYYVSPLGRAVETASHTLKRLGRAAETLDWLQEVPLRRRDPELPWETVIWDWLPEKWTAEPAFYDREAWQHTPVMEQAGVPAENAMVCEGLDALLARHGYTREGELYRADRPNRDSIALFCHFGVICVMLSHLLGISPVPLWHGFAAAPGSVTTLYTEEREKGIASFRCASFGDVSHLYAAGEPVSFSARFCETYDNFDERH